ncbi:molybdopterin guanine dinucleotide-containing S/N-oxide reductase [Pseudonocardia ailaonensis]|uniref:Molybdopterin guanine dinucleotide-containing S/N-oxide reductase n=1 Tax=Pseudonocardia ailaonensis TaxID=367279 RepID=A0ABN2N3F2_9PSEU
MSTRRVPHGSHWGAYEALVEGDRVVGVAAATTDRDPAALLHSVPESVHSASRVRAPAVRRGWLDGRERTGAYRRGRDGYVEVSWPDALDLVAGEVRRVLDEYGPGAVFGGSYGWASAGRFHHAKTQLNRMLALLGGYISSVGSYSHAAGTQILPHVLGYDANNGPSTAWESLAAHTDTWVMFGGCPRHTMQVEPGGTGDHRGGPGLDAVVAAGTEIVVVNPVRSDGPTGPNCAWWPVRPNTDTALMLGLTHTLVSEGLHDTGFLDRHTVGWDVFCEYLLGKHDGVPKDAEWAASIAELDAGEIRALARRMAAGRTFVSTSWSLQRADHGEQPYWMTVVLAAALGQIGLPGGGFGFGVGSISGVGTPRQPFAVPALRKPPNPLADHAIPVARIADMLLAPGAGYEFDGRHRTYPDVRLVYWAGGNPFHHHQDLGRLSDAWQRPETVIAHEQYWTASARHADIVLPATTTLERNDIGASSKDPFLVAMHRAVPPVGEARSDHAILRDVAARLGIEDAFTEGRDEEGWLRHLWAQGVESARAAGVELPGFEEFWAAGSVRLPLPPPEIPFAGLRHGEPLRTPSGRIEIFSATVDSYGYDECPGHPVWLEPAEWLGAAEPGQLHLLSTQPATRLHSQLDTGPVAAASKIHGREACRINPHDAATRGIVEGSLIEIRSARGTCLAGARLDAGVRPGVVVLPTGAWYDPDENDPTLDRHGNPNVLTADRGTSRLAQGPTADTTLVEIRPSAAGPPALRAHLPPALARRAPDRGGVTP